MEDTLQLMILSGGAQFECYLENVNRCQYEQVTDYC